MSKCEYIYEVKNDFYKQIFTENLLIFYRYWKLINWADQKSKKRFRNNSADHNLKIKWNHHVHIEVNFIWKMTKSQSKKVGIKFS